MKISMYFIVNHLPSTNTVMSNNCHINLEKNAIDFFATNSDFLIPIFLQPNVVDLRYFNL